MSNLLAVITIRSIVPTKHIGEVFVYSIRSGCQRFGDELDLDIEVESEAEIIDLELTGACGFGGGGSSTVGGGGGSPTVGGDDSQGWWLVATWW
ncbi:unnamed protein product [Lactuca virosa]|uniref:Uncharacterized protein n=1 Tax=Lactuca virosa TaxID=75947 RepID=A0AAU9PNI4_9ASTR|nr:unnamed protein product [Lactuca virosa]